MKAIIYTSNTGHTKQYAEFLGKACSIEVYDLKQAKKNLTAGDEVFYLGWLMGGNVSGLKKAVKLYKIKGIGTVGLGPENTQLDAIKVQNGIDVDTPLFYLPGGIEFEKLRGIPKMMMGIIKKSVYTKIETNQPHTDTDKAMYDLFARNESLVNEKNITEIENFIKNN